MTVRTKPLSDAEVRQAKPKDKEFNLGDGNGLFLRVKPTGSKLWILNYTRPTTRKRANLGLGAYPTLSLSDARKKAHELRSVLALDIDPKEYRQEQQQKRVRDYANTLEHVTREWLQLKHSSVSESYYGKLVDRLEKYIFPKLGRTPIHKLTAMMAIEAIKPVANRGKLETVKRLCRWTNEVMVYAVNTGLIHANPLAGIGKAFKSPQVVNLPTLRPEQLPELMARINQSSTKIVTRCLIEWQLHTMVRPGEAAATRWSEVDFEKALWVIPAERMKMGRAHVVPLTPQTLNIPRVLQPITGHREFVFPSDHHPRKSANSQSANRALKRMGYHGQLVSHGLRALASTTLNENGFDPDVIEAALAHVDKNAIRAAYNRAQYIERRRAMMEWWSNHIQAAATGDLSVSGRAVA